MLILHLCVWGSKGVHLPSCHPCLLIFRDASDRQMGELHIRPGGPRHCGIDPGAGEEEEEEEDRIRSHCRPTEYGVEDRAYFIRDFR